MSTKDRLRVIDQKKIKCDNVCKLLMSNRQILAAILNEFVPEYRKLSREEVEKCIEEDGIRISGTPVECGLTNIQGRNGEKIVLGEGTVFFDLLFYCEARRECPRL